MNIRRRLLLTFTLVALVGGLALFAIAGWKLSRATLEFYQHDLETEATALAGGLSEMMGESDEEGGAASLQVSLQRTQTDDHKHYIVIDPARRILASTDSSISTDQLALTSEIQSALRGKMGDRISHGTAYVAAPILSEGQVRGVLRLSAPMAPAYKNARRAWLELAAAMLPILILVAAASLWLGRTIAQPLWQLHGSALRLAEGSLNERVKIDRSDEIGELGQAFNFMAERLNLLLQAQRSFVSNAAHELRTPLMNLKLRVEALQDEGLPESQRQLYAREAANEIEHMANLVTGLLTLARLDEGRYQTKVEAFDLVALLHDLIRQWRIRANAAQITFETQIPDNLPEAAISASDLRMILDNLLGNAIKYTPSGGIIRLSIKPDGTTIRFEIDDSGFGFTPEEGKHLFERFYRVQSQPVPGTGLGLAIVQSVLEEYRGTITARSDGPNQGSTFTVTLPALV